MTENRTVKREYTSLLGLKEGARRVHVHLTEIVPETQADRTSHYTHDHAAEEAFYILEGEAVFKLADGSQRSLKPGDLVFYPSQLRHGEFRIISDRLKYLVIRSVEEADKPCCCGGDKKDPVDPVCLSR